MSFGMNADLRSSQANRNFRNFNLLSHRSVPSMGQTFAGAVAISRQATETISAISIHMGLGSFHRTTPNILHFHVVCRLAFGRTTVGIGVGHFAIGSVVAAHLSKLLRWHVQTVHGKGRCGVDHCVEREIAQFLWRETTTQKERNAFETKFKNAKTNFLFQSLQKKTRSPNWSIRSIWNDFVS